METNREPPPARQEWADILRGLAIVLVALGHVLGGLIFASYIRGDRDAAEQLRDWIYAFHMPAFLWASGLFAAPSLRKYGPAGFVGRKAATLLYPYLVWGIIQWGCLYLFRGSTNAPFEPFAPLLMLFDPHYSFWFLYILFALMVLFAVCWTRRGPRILLTAGLLGGFAVQEYAVDHWPVAIAMLCQFGLYFILGPWTAPLAERLAKETPLGILMVAVPAAFAGLTVLMAYPFEPKAPYFFLRAVLGLVGLAALAVVLERLRKGVWLRVLGRHSLEIYIVSGFAAVPARLLLHRYATDDLAVHAIVGTAAAILVPLALVEAARRVGFRYLFAWPYPKREAAAAPR